MMQQDGCVVVNAPLSFSSSLPRRPPSTFDAGPFFVNLAWIQDRLSRYPATNGEDGPMDASIGDGKGMVPTLLLTTLGHKSGNVSDYVIVLRGAVHKAKPCLPGAIRLEPFW
jgi:hypothetical protein